MTPDLEREVRAAIPHEDGCCARGCIADRGPCCGRSGQCRCSHARLVPVVVRLIEAHREAVTADVLFAINEPTALEKAEAERDRYKALIGDCQQTLAAEEAETDRLEAAVARVRAHCISDCLHRAALDGTETTR